MFPINYESLSGIILALLLTIGLIALFFGGDWLCRGGSAIALNLRVNPVVIGLTIVAITTSMPEFMASFCGAINGKYGLAIGNIIGSNLANISLILGISALVCPIVVHSKLINQEVPLLIGVTTVFTLMGWNGTISRMEGIMLLTGTATYLIYIVKAVRKEQKEIESDIVGTVDDKKHGVLYCLFFILLGGGALQLGAELLVHASIEVATRVGVSELLIGLTIVAIGTSLPELAASVIAAAKGHPELCAGNLVGSNLFNILLIGGGVSSVYSMEIDKSLFRIEYPAMFILTALIWQFFATEHRISRREGALLIVAYILIMALSTASQLRQI